MLIIPSPQFRRRRGRLREGPPPSAYEVLVTRVTLFDPTAVYWHFSSSWDGDSECAALTVNDGASGWVSPVGVDAFDDVSIRAFYSGVTLNLISSMWQLLTQIEGFTFADGQLAVPRSGVVVAG